MGCFLQTPAVTTYLVRFLSATVTYAVLVTIDGMLFRRFHLSGMLAYLIALLPAAGILGQIASVGLYLGEETDEF